MYYGKEKAVPVPTRTKDGYPARLKNGYVYWVTNSVWDPVRKKTTDRRVSIGRLCQDGTGLMFPNDNYFDIFAPRSSKSGQVAAGAASEATLRPAGRTDFNMSYGCFAALQAAAEKVGCAEALTACFPKQWEKIRAVCLHAIVGQNSTAQSFPGWCFDNYCGLGSSLSDSFISQLYVEIAGDAEARHAFMCRFRENFHRRFPGSKERVIAFDSTNQVTESKGQELARYGKSKTGESLPIINTALYVDEITGVPMWYEHFDGNVLDKSQTPFSVMKAGALGFNKIFLMMDRGYYSWDTVNRIEDQGIGFGVMMPKATELTGKTIQEWKNTIRLREEYYIPCENVYGMQCPWNLVFDNKMPCYGYLFYDDERCVEERNSIHGKLSFFRAEAQKRKRFTEKMQRHFAQRGLIISKTEGKEKGQRNFTIETDCEMVEAATADSGFFMVLSNRSMTAREMITIARGRDKAEKSFCRLKSHLDLSRSHTHNGKTYAGKMFVSFVALVYLQAFAYFERNVLSKKSSETVNTLMSELHKYKIWKGDCGWSPTYALNKKQKEIFEAVDIAEECLKSSVKKLHL